MGIFNFFKKIIQNYNDEQNAEFKARVDLHKEKEKEFLEMEIKKAEFQDYILEVFSGLKSVKLLDVMPIPSNISKTFSYGGGILSFLPSDNFSYWYFNDDKGHYLVKRAHLGVFRDQCMFSSGNRKIKIINNRCVLKGYTMDYYKGIIIITKKNKIKNKTSKSQKATSKSNLHFDLVDDNKLINNNKPKKTKSNDLNDDQKHWLGLVDMRVNSIPFDSIKDIYTAEALGNEHFIEYKKNETEIPETERQEVALSRVKGLLSINDYILSNGSDAQKYHYKSSLKGALLYASSLGINIDELKKF